MNRMKRRLVADWLRATGSFGRNRAAAQATTHALRTGEVLPEFAVHWLLSEMRARGCNSELAIELFCEFKSEGQIPDPRKTA